MALNFVGIAIGEGPDLKMNRTTIAMVGAVRRVALHVISLPAATYTT